MGLISRFRAAFGRAPAEKSQGSAGVPAQGFLPTLGATPSATRLLISQGTAMAVSAVYACVSIRSQDVARCTPRLFEKAKEEGEKRKLITNHPVAKLFARPNERQNWFEFCRAGQRRLSAPRQRLRRDPARQPRQAGRTDPGQS